MSDPHVELAALQAKAWDRMNQRGHQLQNGPWVVLQTTGAVLHRWHVLCHKSCRRCRQSVSIERRVIAGTMQFRMITPSHPCSNEGTTDVQRWCNGDPCGAAQCRD